MKKLTLLCAALLIAGVAVAETDYLASDWVDALKEGRTYNTRGKTGLLVTPRVSGTLYVDTIAEQTSGSGVTLDGVTLKDGATVANTIVEKTAGNGVVADSVTLKDGGVQTSILPITTYGIGAVPAAVTGTVTVTEYGDGINHRTLLRAVDMPIVMAEGGTGTNGVGSTKIYDFPEGVIELEGCSVANYAITVDTNALDNADGGDWSFGTAAAGGASGLASTEVDFIASTGVDPITNVVFAYTATDAAWDGSTTAKDLYANQEVDDGDIAAACTNLVSFDMTIDWRNLGDD